MSGMLPGVEAARRRRFHDQINSNLNNTAGGSTDTTPAATNTGRTSFCLYATNHNVEVNSKSRQRSHKNKVICDDEKLDAVAKEAKMRLDHRLQTHRNSAAISR